MRKLIPFILLILLYSCEKEVSEKQADYFLKFHGTDLNDEAGDVCELPGGGYAIVGTSETKERGKDISMIITDRFGRQVGDTKFFGSKYNDKSNDLYLSDEGLIISGAVPNAVDTTKLDAVLIQTDFEGNKIGELHSYGGSNNDEAFASLKKGNGGFFFVGYTNSFGSNNQYYIVSLDENFNNPKVSANNTGDQIVLKKIIKFRDNQYFSAGTRIVNVNTNTSQISILFINEAGNIGSVSDFGDKSKANEFAAMVQQNDSTLFILSTLKDGTADGKLNLRKIVYKLDQVNPEKMIYMEQRSSVVFSETGSLEANSLAVKDDGCLAILGTKTHNLDKNIVLLLVDENGNKIGETKEFGGSDGDQTGKSLVYLDGSILILGNNTVGGNSMITLIRTDDKGNLWD